MLDTIRYLIAKTLKKARLASVRNASVDPSSQVESGSAFIDSSMGRHSFCGYDSDIYRARIGSFTSIANGVVIGGARHPMEWVGMSPVFYAGRDSIPAKFSEFPLALAPETTIGHDVWIGRSAIVLSGVHIGNGAVVGAGAVVTKDVPAYGVVVGNPAKLIRYRFDLSVIEEMERLQWWDWNEARLKQLAQYIKSPDQFIAAAEQLSAIE